MGLLNEKAGIITGAASGMGRATARLFTEEGAAVVLADVSEDGEAVARELQDKGHDARFVRADVSKAADVQALVAAAVAAHGRLNFMFNNAGIEGRAGTLVEDYPEDDWDRVLAVNLKGVFLGMKYGIPEMLKGGGGAIVNTASIAGMIGVPGMAAYTASKGAVIQLTKVAALEYANQGIRVNAIAPGFIRTEMTRRLRHQEMDPRIPAAARVPIGRAGTPEEIAKTALYLASDLSSFTTGTVVIVDGGTTAE